MFKRLWNMRWTLLLVLLLLSTFRCKHTPTEPEPPGQLEDFRSAPAIVNEFEAYKGAASFQVNVPLAGDYRLAYTSTRKAAEIVFRLTQGRLLTAVLETGDEIVDVTLEKGAINGPATQITEDVQIFENAIFSMDPSFGTLILIRQKEIFVPTPTPTPRPSATPTPKPTSTPVTSQSTPTPSSMPTPTPFSSEPTPTPPSMPTPTPAATTDAKMIVAVGDSITYGIGSSGGGNYPAQLRTKLRNAGYNVIVSNQGMPGARTVDVSLRFPSLIAGANIVLIMVGTNDVTNTTLCPAPSFCNAVGHIKAMVNTARNAGVTPLVSTIIQINAYSTYGWLNPYVREFNAQIFAGVGAPIVDNYNAIRTHGGDALFPDALHLNNQGYEVMAGEWYQAIIAHNLLK